MEGGGYKGGRGRRDQKNKKVGERKEGEKEDLKEGGQEDGRGKEEEEHRKRQTDTRRPVGL